MKHTTFEGKTYQLSELSQQHISNIIWLNLVIETLNQKGYMSGNHSLIPITKEEYLRQLHSILKEKYDGELLIYRPHAKFALEIEMLETHNLLLWNEERTKADIVLDYKGVDEKIGEYIPLQIQRKNKLEKLIE